MRRSFLLRASNGDARTALNALEIACRICTQSKMAGERITVDLIEQAVEKTVPIRPIGRYAL